LNKQRVTIVFALGMLLVSQLLFAGENLYRYRDHAGDIVMDDNIPPEFVAKGYEVLSRTGRVLEVVLPHSVQLEKERRVAGEGALEAEAQKREDTILLRSYSSLADLESARDRRIQLLDREVSIVDSNLTKSRQQLELSRAKAANHQRSGRVVPKVLLDNIADLSQQILDAEQMMKVRATERQTVSNKYQRYVKRFSVLKGLGDEKPVEKNHPSKLAIDPASAQLVDG